MLGGRWIPSAPGSAAVRAAIEPSFARGALDPKRPRVGSSALLLPAEEDIFQLCTPEPLLRGRHQDSKKVYSHGAVLGTLWFSDQVLRLSRSSLTITLTGEPARPPVLSLCSSRISRGNRLGRRSCRQNVCCAHRVSHGGIGSAAGPVVRTSVARIAHCMCLWWAARPGIRSLEGILVRG